MDDATNASLHNESKRSCRMRENKKTAKSPTEVKHVGKTNVRRSTSCPHSHMRSISLDYKENSQFLKCKEIKHICIWQHFR